MSEIEIVFVKSEVSKLKKKDEYKNLYKNMSDAGGDIERQMNLIDSFTDLKPVKISGDALLKAKELRLYVDSYMGVQKAREQIANRVNMFVRDFDLPVGLGRAWHNEMDAKLYDVEQDLKKRMLDGIKDIPLYNMWLKHVTGIGETLTAKMLSFIGEMGRWDRISSLWQYAGIGVENICQNCNKRWFETDLDTKEWIDRKYSQLIIQTEKLMKNTDKESMAKRRREMRQNIENSACRCNNPQPKAVAPKRHKGIAAIDYNPKLKTTMYLVAIQFVKQGRYYRKLYDAIKLEEQRKNDQRPKDAQISLGHLENRTRRRVEKYFLSHLWQIGRQLEGLPVTEPYAVAHLERDWHKAPLIDMDGKI